MHTYIHTYTPIPRMSVPECNMQYRMQNSHKSVLSSTHVVIFIGCPPCRNSYFIFHIHCMLRITQRFHTSILLIPSNHTEVVQRHVFAIFTPLLHVPDLPPIFPQERKPLLGSRPPLGEKFAHCVFLSFQEFPCCECQLGAGGSHVSLYIFSPCSQACVPTSAFA
jgi:hypothetical protein